MQYIARFRISGEAMQTGETALVRADMGMVRYELDKLDTANRHRLTPTSLP
jgi:hypothetical protein